MDDAAAIRLCRGGDGDAYRHLVERYQREAMGHALAILGNRQDAEDAVQDAFVDAYRALARFDEERRFYPWFYAILRNRCLKLMASRRRHETDALDDVGMLTREGAASVEDVVALEEALKKMPSESREVLMLRHLDGLSYKELAERLGIPIGTVMSRLFRARTDLRAVVAKRPKER